MRDEPYHPDELLLKLEELLAAWVAENKGSLKVAGDPWTALRLLCESPAGMLAVLAWGGDSNLSEEDQDAMGEEILELSIGVNPGLAIDRERATVEEAPGSSRKSLVRLISEARKRVLSLELADDNQTGRYFVWKDTAAIVLPNGIPLSAYKLRFGLTAAIPQEAERVAVE